MSEIYKYWDFKSWGNLSLIRKHVWKYVQLRSQIKWRHCPNKILVNITSIYNIYRSIFINKLFNSSKTIVCGINFLEIIIHYDLFLDGTLLGPEAVPFVVHMAVMISKYTLCILFSFLPVLLKIFLPAQRYRAYKF